MSEEDPPLPKKKKPPGIFGRIAGWFKRQAEWVMETIADEQIGAEIREDLGLNPDRPISETDRAQLPVFASTIDTEKESFAETVTEIQACVTVLLALAEAAKNEQLSAWDTMFFLGTFSANESIRLRSPFVYALGQLSLLLRDDPEELGRLDPAMLVSQLRGDLPPPGGAERFHQRVFASFPILMEILPFLLGKVGIHTDRAGIDVESHYGWDPAPDSPTPESDLVSMRAWTLLLSLPSAPGTRLSITILSVPRTHRGPGLFLSFGGSLSADTVVDGTRYRITTGGSGAFDLFIPLGQEAMPLTAGGDPEAFIRIEAIRSDPAVPAFRIGEAERTRLDVGAIKLGLEVSGSGGGVAFSFEEAALVINLGDSDGFLKNLSDKELALRFAFGIVVDSENGIHLAGGSKAAVTLPAASTVIGIFTIHHIDLRLGAGKEPDDFKLELSAALGLKLGPFRASVDRIGLQVEGGFREGNLGIMQLEAGFRFPNGIGLLLDTKHIKGGGYLFIDRERREYAGVLEVKLGPVNVKAFGLLQTRTEEREDWSLLIFLFGQFNPIPLVLGINFSGAGGMIGVRRGVDVAKLQAGARLGALDDILFPKNPIADAPRLINQLRTIFPHTPGALTIGPFLELGFLDPQVIILRVGVIFQMDQVDPGADSRDLTRVIILGQLRAESPPKRDKPVVRIICDILGVIDLQAKSVFFSARLRDSKVATFTLTGMVVLRKDYGDKPLFLLAVGGFHPDFKDIPPELPSPIDRLGIQAIKIKGFKLEVSGYFALTPNTTQFGVSGKLKGSIKAASVEVSLTIDALIYDEPYTHFVVTAKLVAQIKIKGQTLFGVKADARIEGPGYWRASGKFVIEILWWEIPLPFDVDCGEKPALVPANVNLGEMVQAALSREAAWEALIPPGEEALVTLASNAGAPGTFAHPLAGLSVAQNVVPLGMTIERFGAARVVGANRFEVTALRVGPVLIPDPPRVRRPFGRAQYFDVTDEQRLSLPSFEPFDAGVTAAGADFTFGPSVAASLKYETAYLAMEPEAPRGRISRAELFATALPVSALGWQSRGGAAARSPLRERARAAAGEALRLGVSEAPLVAVRSDTLEPADLVLEGQAAVSTTAAAQTAALSGAGLMILEAFELE